MAVTSLDEMATTPSLSVTNQSINGNRTDTNHLAVDGGMNLDSGSNGSQINNVGIDFIQQYLSRWRSGSSYDLTISAQKNCRNATPSR